jgi:hypothetical protein
VAAARLVSACSLRRHVTSKGLDLVPPAASRDPLWLKCKLVTGASSLTLRCTRAKSTHSTQRLG